MSFDKLSAADREIFEQAMQGVKPLTQNHAESSSARPAPIPIQSERDNQQVLVDMLSDHYDPSLLDLAAEVSFQRPGVQHSVMRKLKRGQYSITAELDLHGLIIPQARQALVTFLEQSRQDNRQCVRIIHGKGLRSPNTGPVLKPLVAKWLSLRDEVLAYCTARPVDGGTGAVYVLLKK